MPKLAYHFVLRRLRRLRPSPESVAGAAALYDPELMIQLKATRPRHAISSVTTAAEQLPAAKAPRSAA